MHNGLSIYQNKYGTTIFHAYYAYPTYPNIQSSSSG